MHAEEGVPGSRRGSASLSMGTETSSGQGEGLCSLLARLGPMGLDRSCPGPSSSFPLLTIAERLMGKEEHPKKSYRIEPSIPMAAPREV